MRRCDVVTPPASTRPPIEADADSPRDFLREVFADYAGALPVTREAFRALAFRLIDDAIAIISGQFPTGSELAAFGARATGPEAQEPVIRLLHMLRYARDWRLRLDALCFLRILGDEGRSLDEIGIEAGLGAGKKGTVHKRFREIQRLLGDLPARGDKSPEARAKYRQIRTGSRRPRLPWSGLSAWSQPLHLAA